MSKYYSLEVVKNVADLYIFGEITSYKWDEKDRDAHGIVKELETIDAEEINVHINSYGGEVSEGLAIYNVLKNNQCKITTIDDGFACSAASIIFMAGDVRIMNRASLLMIHNAWTYASGNANTLRKKAGDLDKITQASVDAYLSRVNLSEEELKQKMDEESWITAEEALQYGFATEILDAKEDGVNQSAFEKIRDQLLTVTHVNSGMLQCQTITSPELTFTPEKVAASIMEQLKPVLDKFGQSTKEQQNSTGWGAFFMEKGE